MIVIPSGSFTMSRKPAADGRKDDDPEGIPKSTPAHEVSIDRVFAAAIYDVTRDEYGAFVHETGRADGPGCYVWTRDQWTDDG